MITTLPDSTLVYVPGHGETTVGEIRGERARYITTEEAARLFSYRPETWARWAPSIPGAYRDRMWRLPLAGCEAHIARLREPKRRRRLPWDARSTTAHALEVVAALETVRERILGRRADRPRAPVQRSPRRGRREALPPATTRRDRQVPYPLEQPRRDGVDAVHGRGLGGLWRGSKWSAWNWRGTERHVLPPGREECGRGCGRCARGSVRIVHVSGRSVTPHETLRTLVRDGGRAHPPERTQP